MTSRDLVNVANDPDCVPVDWKLPEGSGILLMKLRKNQEIKLKAIAKKVR